MMPKTTTTTKRHRVRAVEVEADVRLLPPRKMMAMMLATLMTTTMTLVVQ